MSPRTLALASLALACAHPPPGVRPATSPPPALRGVVVSDLDRTQAPCRDFFEYANGAWRAANPIPPSLSRWSRRWAAAETAKDQLKAILDEAAAAPGPRGTPGQVAGDFYAACLDEAAVEAAGVAPIAPLLTEIDRGLAPLRSVSGQAMGLNGDFRPGLW